MLFVVACFAPILTLIPDGSSLLFPLKVRRSRSFYISSNVTLYCEQSLKTIVKWSIYKCGSSCQSEIQVSVISSATTTAILIPAKTLPYGLYKFKLTVTMSIALDLLGSAEGYVRVIATGISANPVQFGTSMITRGYEQDLTLDPGRFSGDLDENIFNISVCFP